jgi:GNAT superfamily N-acetyltransferase
MSVTHPSAAKLAALRERWLGEERRLCAIAEALLLGEDWTEHLRGLPFVDEIPRRDGEMCGRDLRGANLRRFLRPPLEIRPAHEREAALVAGITLEAQLHTTPLNGVSPFPTDIECADQMALAIRRGEVFLLARCMGRPIGVVRLAERHEFDDLTGHCSYTELSGLAVLPTHRRLGVGQALIEAAELHATEEGHDHVLLRTTEELGLVHWYERLGYEVRRVRQLTFQDAPTYLDVLLTRDVRAAVAERIKAAQRRGPRLRA